MGGSNDIPKMMQLVAGRTGQEYNTRKHRKGAFWEDRYHATAIEAGKHLQRCLIYTDLNMVRAGAVKHPEDWVHGGYQEIQGHRRRNTIIDLNAVVAALGLCSVADLRKAHGEWVDEALQGAAVKCEEMWSQSVAVGCREFVMRTQTALGHRGRNRAVSESSNGYVLREAEVNYGPDFGVENWPIGPRNTCFWDICY